MLLFFMKLSKWTLPGDETGLESTNFNHMSQKQGILPLNRTIFLKRQIATSPQVKSLNVKFIDIARSFLHL